MVEERRLDELERDGGRAVHERSVARRTVACRPRSVRAAARALFEIFSCSSRDLFLFSRLVLSLYYTLDSTNHFMNYDRIRNPIRNCRGVYGVMSKTDVCFSRFIFYFCSTPFSIAHPMVKKLFSKKNNGSEAKSREPSRTKTQV